MMQRTCFNNKTVVITGTSRGVGYALLELLLEDNINAIAIVRDKKGLKELEQQYSNALQIIETDLSDPNGQKIAAHNVKTLKIDYLVHNAAIIEPLGSDALLKANSDSLRKILETNILAPILLTNMLGNKLTVGSRILNISSVAGDQAIPELGAYCVTKVAIDRFSESLKLDSPQGILATSVHPGEVNTGMQADLRNHSSVDFTPTRFKKRFNEDRLISPKTAAIFLKWLLLESTNEQFQREKHSIYKSWHQPYWNSKSLPSPE